MNDKISTRQLWWLLVTVAIIWFANLEYRTLVKPDEGRYAEIPREMVKSGDWTTPRLNELKYFEKPPLQYWATAVAYEVFGEHQWTSRIWSGLTGFAGLLLVWFAGMRLFGREAAGYAAMILGSSLLYALIGHVNTLDMGVTFFMSLGIFAMLIAQGESEVKSQRYWMMLAWAGMGLAVLSKGLMGLILPGTALFLYCILQRDWSMFKKLHFLPGLTVFFLIVTPWFYLVMKANPEFFERFFIYEHYTRFTTKDLGRYQPWYYFVPILLAGALPWTVLMFDSMLGAWRSGKRIPQVFSPERFLLIWAVFIYVFFTISGSKLPSYLLPMFPPLALLMAVRLTRIRERVLMWELLPVIPMLLILIGFALNIDRFADTPQQAELYPQYANWLIGGVSILVVGVLLAALLLKRQQKTVSVVVLAMSSLLCAQISLSGYNTIAHERSAKHIAAAIKDYVKPEVPFYSVLDYEQTLPFYIKHTFTLVQYQDEMAYGIKQEPEKFIPTLNDFVPIWRAQKQALAIMPLYAYPILQQLGVEMNVIFKDTQYVVVQKP